MKIHEYNEMMAYLLRPREKFQRGGFRPGASSKPLTKEKFIELYDKFLKSKAPIKTDAAFAEVLNKQDFRTQLDEPFTKDSVQVRRTSKRLEDRGEPAFLEMGRGPVLPSDEDPINPFGPKPTGPVLPDKSMMASSDSYQNYVRAALELGLKPIRIDEFESLTPIMDVNEILNLTEQLNRSKNATGGLAGIINL